MFLAQKFLDKQKRKEERIVIIISPLETRDINTQMTVTLTRERKMI